MCKHLPYYVLMFTVQTLLHAHSLRYLSSLEYSLETFQGTHTSLTSGLKSTIPTEDNTLHVLTRIRQFKHTYDSVKWIFCFCLEWWVKHPNCSEYTSAACFDAIYMRALVGTIRLAMKKREISDLRNGELITDRTEPHVDTAIFVFVESNPSEYRYSFSFNKLPHLSISNEFS